MLTAVSLLGCLMLYAIARIIGIAFSGLQYHRDLHFTKFLLSSFWECLLLSGHLLWLNGIIECNLHVTLNSVVYLLMNHTFTRSAFTWWKHIDVLSLPDCSIICQRGIPDFHHPTSSFFLQADVTNEHINSNNSAMLVNFRISTVNPKGSSSQLMHRICPSAQPHHVNSLAPVLRKENWQSSDLGKGTVRRTHGSSVCSTPNASYIVVAGNDFTFQSNQII